MAFPWGCRPTSECPPTISSCNPLSGEPPAVGHRRAALSSLSPRTVAIARDTEAAVPPIHRRRDERERPKSRRSRGTMHCCRNLNSVERHRDCPPDASRVEPVSLTTAHGRIQDKAPPAVLRKSLTPVTSHLSIRLSFRPIQNLERIIRALHIFEHEHRHGRWPLNIGRARRLCFPRPDSLNSVSRQCPERGTEGVGSLGLEKRADCHCREGMGSREPFLMTDYGLKISVISDSAIGPGLNERDGEVSLSGCATWAVDRSVDDRREGGVSGARGLNNRPPQSIRWRDNREPRSDGPP
jgi:hypothetical protein